MALSHTHRQRIEARRRELGVTIGQLARRAQVDRAGLSRWINGHSDNPTTGYLDKLHRALDVEHQEALAEA